MVGNDHKGKSPGSPKWMRPKKSKTMNQMLDYSAVGIEMGACVGIGVFLGAYLDRRFGTEPYLVLLFGFCGLAAAFKALLVLIRKLQRMMEELSEDQDQ